MELEELPFEEAFQQLEETVRRLGEGDLTLDGAVALFERGTKLAQACQAKLDKAELRVKRLMASPDGTLDLTPFELEE